MCELKPCKKGHNPEVNKAYGAFCVSCSGGLVLHEETNYYKSKQVAIDAWNNGERAHGNLKSCPLCERPSRVCVNGKGKFFVFCTDCLLRSDVYDTEEEAVEAWNKRLPLHEEAENLRDILQRAMYILRDDYEQGKYSSFINEIVEVFARLDMFPYTDWIKQRVKNDN